VTVADSVLAVVEEKHWITRLVQYRHHIQIAAPIGPTAVNGNDCGGSVRVAGHEPATKRLPVNGRELHGFERDIEIL